MRSTAHRQVDAHRLSQLVEGDLDWIVMKCLEKDCTRRYGTAVGLAEDIGRHLSDEPVHAGRPTRVYRLKKFIRRNKAIVATSSVAVAALVLGIILTSIALVRARRHAEFAEARITIAKAQSLCAAGDFEQAEKLIREIPPAIIELEAAAVLPIINGIAFWNGGQGEAQLAEARVKLEDAQSLIAAGDFEQADQLISEVPPAVIELEAATNAPLIITLAICNGGQQRWVRSAALYELVLLGPAQFGLTGDSNLIATYHEQYAPILVETRNLVGYDALRDAAFVKFGNPDKIIVANRLQTACLLLPANDRQMATLSHWADTTSKISSTATYRSWYYASLALFEHRRGNHARAVQLGKKCLAAEPTAACEARAHVIMAMALLKASHFAAAEAQMAACRETIDGKFRGALGPGSYVEGAWNDWLIDRILLREADQLNAARAANRRP